MNVQHGLSNWIKEHPYQPIVAMETFKNDIVAKKELRLQPMSPTDTHDKQLNPHEAVALFLHDAGEIIYFKDEDFVVVNPHRYICLPFNFFKCLKLYIIKELYGVHEEDF